MAIRYHSGTAAFGSLILAIVNMIRIVLTYIKKKFSDPEVLDLLLSLCFSRAVVKEDLIPFLFSESSASLCLVLLLLLLELSRGVF
jgi:hypothetical protein